MKTWNWISKIRATNLIQTTILVFQGYLYSRKSTCRDKTFQKKKDLKRKKKASLVRFGRVVHLLGNFCTILTLWELFWQNVICFRLFIFINFGIFRFGILHFVTILWWNVSFLFAFFSHVLVCGKQNLTEQGWCGAILDKFRKVISHIGGQETSEELESLGCHVYLH